MTFFDFFLDMILAVLGGGDDGDKPRPNPQPR